MMTIRPATYADVPQLLAIYAHYVKETAITFDLEVPSAEDFAAHMERILERYPYLAAVWKDDNVRGRAPDITSGSTPGIVVGYAYAGPFHPRAAYDWCCETTIYLDPSRTGLGAGRLLYESLESALRAMGILNMYACIAVPGNTIPGDAVPGNAVPGDSVPGNDVSRNAGDEYLTYNSALFHEHMGFCENGRFHQCGYKFGRWYDMIWMEKIIGEHTDPQPAVKTYQAIPS